MREKLIILAKAQSVRIIMTVLILSLISTKVFAVKFTGRITDPDGQPLFGATALVQDAQRDVTGAATDDDGRFTISTDTSFGIPVWLSVSTIGYGSDSVLIKDGITAYDFVLTPTFIDVGSVSVVSSNVREVDMNHSNKEQIDKYAARSFIPTNPVSAVRQPQLVREGSNHSSKLRVAGTSPKYFINGIDIGYNPNHYGVFSVIPSSVVQSLDFFPDGTSSEYGLSSVLEFNTIENYSDHFKGELNLSFLESTASFSIGKSKFFALGSFRKSVIDKMVTALDIKSSRATIPPTNFQDIFLSTGYRFSPSQTIVVDQYHARDYLAVNTSAATNNSNTGTNTYQHTSEHYIGARYNGMFSQFLLDLSLSTRFGLEEYRAYPADAKVPSGVNLDLVEKFRTSSASAKITTSMFNSDLVVGFETEQVNKRDIELVQNNWNFLPPDANSDNPYIFQEALNRQYGQYSGSNSYTDAGTYFSVKRRIGSFEVETGLRSEWFSALNNSMSLLHRNRITWNISDEKKVSLFAGTYAENPIRSILSPYQVMIQDQPENLDPIRTRLLSASYKQGPVNLKVFSKRISNLPLPSPIVENFADPRTMSTATAIESIEMQPASSINFYGMDIAYSLNNIIPKVDFYGFYGYSYAEKRDEYTITGVTTAPYEFNAPHKFLADITWRTSSSITLGAEMSVRSGYAYTPSYSYDQYTEASQSVAASLDYAGNLENSSRFPVNMSLNLHVEFDLGNSSLYMNVANVTNSSNPMINTTNGFIYDAGVLPSLGYKLKF